MAIKIYDICKQCFDEHSTTSVFIIGDFTNNDYHTITCSSGKHEIKYVSRKPEYPIFFQNGVLAYHKEEYFEAFTSIYHCYEMFRYTMVQIFLMESFGLNYQEMLEYLKPISRSSVQIDGAFNALYAGYFKEKPIDIPGTFKNLRNDIVHGSHYPVKKDVEKCIKEVLKFINEVEEKLPISKNEPYSLLEKVGTLKIIYLLSKDIITKEEIDSNKVSIVSNNSYFVGNTPTLDKINNNDFSIKRYSFNEVLDISKKLLKNLQKNGLL